MLLFREHIYKEDHREEHRKGNAVLDSVEGSENGPSARATPASAITSSLDPYLVLVVDDEAPIVETMKVVIEEAGYHVLGAANGKGALIVAQNHWPALVITDLMMPHINGARLIEELRRIAAQRDLPVPPIILMSAASASAIRSAGATETLAKPFEIDDLESLLQRYLGPPSATK